MLLIVSLLLIFDMGNNLKQSKYDIFSIKKIVDS